MTRNRIRRRLRAAVAGAADELQPGGLYLFSTDPGVESAEFAVLESSVATLVRQVGETP